MRRPALVLTTIWLAFLLLPAGTAAQESSSAPAHFLWTIDNLDDFEGWDGQPADVPAHADLVTVQMEVDETRLKVEFRLGDEVATETLEAGQLIVYTLNLDVDGDCLGDHLVEVGLLDGVWPTRIRPDALSEEAVVVPDAPTLEGVWLTVEVPLGLLDPITHPGFKAHSLTFVEAPDGEELVFDYAPDDPLDWVTFNSCAR